MRRIITHLWVCPTESWSVTKSTPDTHSQVCKLLYSLVAVLVVSTTDFTHLPNFKQTGAWYGNKPLMVSVVPDVHQCRSMPRAEGSELTTFWGVSGN